MVVLWEHRADYSGLWSEQGRCIKKVKEVRRYGFFFKNLDKNGMEIGHHEMITKLTATLTVHV